MEILDYQSNMHHEKSSMATHELRLSTEVEVNIVLLMWSNNGGIDFVVGPPASRGGSSQSHIEDRAHH